MLNTQVGNTVIAVCKVYTPAIFGRVLTDPTQISAFASDPNGGLTSLPVTRLSVGTYYAPGVLTLVGPWIFRYTGYNGIYPFLFELPVRCEPVGGGGTPTGVQPGQPAPAVVTGNYTMQPSDTVLYVAAGANVTMPLAPSLSAEYVFIAVSGSLETTPVTLNGNGYQVMDLNPTSPYALTTSTQMLTSESTVRYRWNGAIMVLESYRS